MMRAAIGVFLFVFIVAGGEEALAQGSTTSGRVRDLESRFDELLKANEALVPTLERITQRLDQLEKELRATKASPTPSQGPEKSQLGSLGKDIDGLRSSLQKLQEEQQYQLKQIRDTQATQRDVVEYQQRIYDWSQSIGRRMQAYGYPYGYVCEE